MLLIIFLKGLLAGLCGAAIVGPICVMCIRRTIAQGFAVGMAVGLGGALGDAFFAGISAFSLQMLADFLIKHMFYLKILGGLYLFFQGLKIFNTKPQPNNKLSKKTAMGKTVVTVFFLTISNPMTILFFTAIFANLNLITTDLSPISAGLLVFGTFVGSGIWWVFLAGAAHLLRSKLTLPRVQMVNRVSGVFLAVFGILILLR